MMARARTLCKSIKTRLRIWGSDVRIVPGAPAISTTYWFKAFFPGCTSYHVATNPREEGTAFSVCMTDCGFDGWRTFYGVFPFTSTLDAVDRRSFLGPGRNQIPEISYAICWGPPSIFAPRRPSVSLASAFVHEKFFVEQWTPIDPNLAVAPALAHTCDRDRIEDRHEPILHSGHIAATQRVRAGEAYLLAFSGTSSFRHRSAAAYPEQLRLWWTTRPRRTEIGVRAPSLHAPVSAKEPC